jgi:hypothetical protein
MTGDGEIRRAVGVQVGGDDGTRMRAHEKLVRGRGVAEGAGAPIGPGVHVVAPPGRRQIGYDGDVGERVRCTRRVEVEIGGGDADRGLAVP